MKKKPELKKFRDRVPLKASGVYMTKEQASYRCTVTNATKVYKRKSAQFCILFFLFVSHYRKPAQEVQSNFVLFHHDVRITLQHEEMH
jgi:hypothetical protein